MMTKPNKTDVSLIALLVLLIAGGVGFWERWGKHFYYGSDYRRLWVIPIEELVVHPMQYLNKEIIVRGYLAHAEMIYDALIFVDREAAEMQNSARAISVAYPIDAKIACENNYVEVRGVFQWLDVDHHLALHFDSFGIGDVDYFGKIKDKRPFGIVGIDPPFNLSQTSCPSSELPDYYGVTGIHNSSGKRELPNKNWLFDAAQIQAEAPDAVVTRRGQNLFFDPQIVQED